MCLETFNLRGTAERTLHMRDGAPARFSTAARNVLSNTCHARPIGRGGPTA
jgi:hypothetical protein